MFVIILISGVLPAYILGLGVAFMFISQVLCVRKMSKRLLLERYAVPRNRAGATAKLNDGKI